MVEAGPTSRNPANVADYKAKSVLHVPDESRLSYLVNLLEGKDVGKATDAALKAIEERQCCTAGDILGEDRAFILADLMA